jgi:pimeloyl-ACP methyl ester carboxylesterase
VGARSRWPTPSLDDLEQHDASTRIGELDRPLLVVHAVHDEIVDIEQGERTFAAARQPKGFHPLLAADHLVTDRAAAEEVLLVVTAWFDRTLARLSAGTDGQAPGRAVADPGATLEVRRATGSPLHSRTADIAGIPTRWVEAGDGPTVVLVHGIPTGPDLWRHVTPALTGVRVLAFEMVGYARSIPAGEGRDISIAAQARHLNAWLDHLGLERVILVGHDLGGGVVQIAAVERPDRCVGLVLTNAISYDSWPIPSVRAVRALPSLVARTPTPMLKTTLASLLARGHDDASIARESLDIHFAHYAAHGAATALARQAAALDARDTLRVADALPHLQVPSRVVWGLADQFQKASYGQRLARDLGARAIGIPGGKHFTPEDHPGVIARAIREVVEEVA